MELPLSASASCPIFVARQPIYDRAGEIWGYELLFRDSGANRARADLDPVAATGQVIVDGLALATKEIDADSHLLINFPAELLFADGLRLLPQKRCVVELLETIEPTPEALANIRAIKEAGYLVALDDYVGQAGFEPLIELADLVKVEVLNVSTSEILARTNLLRRFGCKLLAEKVEDQRTNDLCRALGYDYFQGYYFGRPQVIKGHTLSPARQARLLLLAEVSDDDYDVKALSRIVRSDLSLSYRLIRFINAPAFGWPKPIETIDQAVVALGQRGLRQWLTVALLVELGESPRTRELSCNSIRRGRFLELLGRAHPNTAPRPDVLFILGVFSQLDALLDQPMSEVVQSLPVSDEIRRALCGEAVPLRLWIDLCEALDYGQFDAAEQLAARLSLTPETLAEAHAAAGSWTAVLLSMNRERSADKPIS